jgi:hypothetical protein
MPLDLIRGWTPIFREKMRQNKKLERFPIPSKWKTLYSMIRKSGNRLSEKIMLNQNAGATIDSP